MHGFHATLNLNSFKDAKLKVKGLPSIIVKDYTRKELKEKNGLKSRIALNITTIKAI